MIVNCVLVPMGTILEGKTMTPKTISERVTELISTLAELDPDNNKVWRLEVLREENEREDTLEAIHVIRPGAEGKHGKSSTD